MFLQNQHHHYFDLLILAHQYIDFTSLIPKSVTATDTREFSIPLNINGSFGMNSPFVSYTCKDVESVTADLKNPVAPLYFPLIKVGVESV